MSKIDLEVTDLNQEEPVEEEIVVEKTPKKRRKQDLISFILVGIGVICIGVALYGLYGIYKEYKKGQDIYNQVAEEFVQENLQGNGDLNNIKNEEATENEADSQIVEPTIPQGPWYEMISVDLEGLQSKYDEVVGWLFFENEDINYPIMHSEVDNEKYLTTAYNGAHSNVGSIYVSAANSGDFSDVHTIIYGHTLHDNTMLSRLKFYMTKSGYYDNHQYFQIFCGNEVLRYQIFAYQEVGIDSFIYREKFDSAKELSDRLLQTSKINPGLNIEDDDKIITFSTCVSDKAYRLVVSAVLVETYDRTEKTVTQN